MKKVKGTPWSLHAYSAFCGHIATVSWGVAATDLDKSLIALLPFQKPLKNVTFAKGLKLHLSELKCLTEY